MKQMNVEVTGKRINTKGTMGRLFRFMKPYRIRIILMVFCLVMGAVFTTQGPYTLGRAMDALVAVVMDGAGGLKGFKAFITVLMQLGCVYILAFLFIHIRNDAGGQPCPATDWNLRHPGLRPGEHEGGKTFPAVFPGTAVRAGGSYRVCGGDVQRTERDCRLRKRGGRHREF